VHWLSEHAAANLLLDEVEAESDRVWNFIIAREIETPDRFRAIQSYRCVHSARSPSIDIFCCAASSVDYPKQPVEVAHARQLPLSQSLTT